MKIIVYIAIVFLCLASCVKSNKEISAKDKPERAAIYYTKCIVEENYDEYVKAMVSCDSASDEYKNKMMWMAKQMVRAKKAEMDSCKNIECIKTEIKYDGNYANTFIRLTYSNDSSETILLPLIWYEDKWRLR